MKIKKISLFIVSILLMFSFSACMGQLQEFVYYDTDTKLINNIARDLDGVTGCEYESVRVAMNMFGKPFSMGPTDPTYRGIITLSEEEGQKLLEEYEWELDDTYVLQNIGDIDTSYLKCCEWYTCNDFDSDIFKTVIVEYVYFNGKDTILFEVHSI